MVMVTIVVVKESDFGISDAQILISMSLEL